MKEKLSLCIDIGGTHIVASVIDVSSMTLYKDAKKYNHVDSNADEKSILSEWQFAVSSVLDKCEHKVDTVAISIPGPFDYSNGICLMDGMHKYQSMLHFDVKKWFSTTFDIDASNIFFYNDAEAFLLGELYHNKLFNSKVVGLTLGTGLGSAFYDSNEVKDLNYGSAIFRDGIAEDYISTRGLVDFVDQYAGKKFNNVKSIVDDESLGKVKEDVFHYLANSLADFIHEYILDLEPDVIIIGGSISKAHEYFLSRLSEKITIPIKKASMDEFNIFCGMASVKYIKQ